MPERSHPWRINSRPGACGHQVRLRGLTTPRRCVIACSIAFQAAGVGLGVRDA